MNHQRESDRSPSTCRIDSDAVLNPRHVRNLVKPSPEGSRVLRRQASLLVKASRMNLLDDAFAGGAEATLAQVIISV